MWRVTLLAILFAGALVMMAAPMLVVGCAQKVGLLVPCSQVPECAKTLTKG